MKREQVKAIFDEALRAEGAEREAVLNERCGDNPQLRREVDELLAAFERAGRFLESPDDAHEGPGATIGHYKLLQEIGEGGFGVVYMAEQEKPVLRKVALKIIKLGMDTKQVIARFEAERQALALMDHPNIAKVLDAGATDTGRPYFVMELVKGIPITEYCDQAQLDTKDRLALFQQVCHAVQHAHLKGIIHRDLKPSNILVTLHDGHPVPKVIDFGIAKATDRKLTDKTLFTEFRQWIGTPDYMAPEQAELSGLDVDTRADIYSLGVLLYELLTGTRPFDMKTLLDKGYEEILRTIREVDPERPSTRLSTMGEQLTAVAKKRHTAPGLLGKAVRGDLDWIVMKALEKDRARRYETANGFAEDIQRFLGDEPVTATPPTVAYRARKYLKRHRVAVTAAAVVFVGLLVSGGLAYGGMHEAQLQRDEATRAASAAVQRTEEAEAAHEREKEQRTRAEKGAAEAKTEQVRAETVLGLLGEMLGSANPNEVKGLSYTVRQLLDDFDRDLGDRLDDQPEVAALLHATMGRTYRALGIYERAQVHLADALSIRRELFGGQHGTYATSLYNHALLLTDQGKYREAEREFRAALAIQRRIYGADVGSILTGLGRVLNKQGDLDGALAAHEKALAIQRRKWGNNHENVAWCLDNIASVLKGKGDLGRAVEFYRLAVDTLRRAVGADHPWFAVGLGNLAQALSKAGEHDAAESMLREAIATYRKSTDDHPNLAWLLDGLGGVLQDRGDLDGAIALSEEALAILEKRVDADHPLVSTCLHNMAVVLIRTGDYERAVKQLDDARAQRLRTFGPEHKLVADCLETKAAALLAMGRFGEAERAARQSLAIRRKVVGGKHYTIGLNLRTVGRVLHAQGRYAEAATSLREALEILRAAHGDEAGSVADTALELGGALTAKGDFSEAEEHLLEVLALRRKKLPAVHPGVALSLNALGHHYFTRWEGGKAEPLFREALKIVRQLYGERNRETATALQNLGSALGIQGKFDESEKHLRAALAIHQSIHGTDHTDVSATLNNIAYALRGKRDYQGAVALQRKALAIERRVLNPDHPEIGLSLSNLSRALAAAADLEGAVRADREALAILSKTLDDSHPWVAQALSFSARLRMVAQDYEGCAAACRRALVGQPSHGLLAMLGLSLLKLEKYAEAEPVLRKCLALRTADNWLRFNAMTMLGGSLAGQGKYADAEPLLIEGYEKMQPPLPAAVRKQEALDRIVKLYEDWKKPDKAAEWRAKR